MLTPEAVSDLYARLPQVRRLPQSIFVVDGTIEASTDPYAYEASQFHRYNAALRDVQSNGKWTIRGMRQAGSSSILVTSSAPDSTWLHETLHLAPVIGPNEALTRARTSAMMKVAPFLPPTKKVRYVEVPVSENEAAAFTASNNLRLVSGPGGVRKYVRTNENFDSVWEYRR